jgi:hypothetical protein
MGYERFLGAVGTQVLPYVGGPFVEAGDRRLRLATPATPGWWRFEVRGRNAYPVEPADVPDLSGRPAVRGYALSGYLVGAGGVAFRLAIGPPDEPLAFSPLIARRWPSGVLLFEALDFESGVEDRVRQAYAQRRPLAGIPGVPAPLRAAYGYAVLLRTAAELGIPARPAEARTRLVELADEGEVAARRILLAADAHRAAETHRHRGAATAQVPAHEQLAPRPPEWMAARDAALARRASATRQRAEERAAAALHAGRAMLHGTRWLADGLLEVRYDCTGDTFVSIVDGDTLRVVDAGFCLQGHDDRLTLESLPVVIREAVETDQLHITAW